MNKMPYQMRRSEFIPLARTYPIPKHEVCFPADASEASLHYASLTNRLRETDTPKTDNYKLGIWAIDKQDHLYQLREVSIHSLLFSETSSRQTVDKYIRWYLGGSAFPPVYGVENLYGQTRLTDGHHRLQAQKDLGTSRIRIWLGLSVYRKLSNDRPYCDAASYPELTLLTFRNKLRIQKPILQDSLKYFLPELTFLYELGRNTIQLRGHEGIVSADKIETLRRWQIINADYEYPLYKIHVTEIGTKILSMIM